MDTAQILCKLRDVGSFLGVFPSDLLPHLFTLPGMLIIYTDGHTQSGTHWHAINIQLASYTSFYVVPFGLLPSAVVAHFIPDSLRRNCAVFDHNRV
jgi:hypothetical protein